MCREDWANRPSKFKVGVLLLLCLCTWSIISAAIVLETSQTEMKLVVNDRVEERNKLPRSAVMLPLCSIVITAKHKGAGYISIFHSPLLGGNRQVGYTLTDESQAVRFPTVISYRGNPSIPQTIPLATINAELERPLPGDRSSYSSEVYLHLSLEM